LHIYALHSISQSRGEDRRYREAAASGFLTGIVKKSKGQFSTLRDRQTGRTYIVGYEWSSSDGFCAGRFCIPRNLNRSFYIQNPLKYISEHLSSRITNEIYFRTRNRTRHQTKNKNKLECININKYIYIYFMYYVVYKYIRLN